MDVFLVPVGAERYELYCEIPDEPHEGGDEPPRGFFRRLVHRFKEMLAEAERDRRQGAPVQASGGWFARLKARSVRWVAESIAEQRLLWHLRSHDAACLHYPDDLAQPQADDLMRQGLSRDAHKHRRWMIIDGIALVVSVVVLGPLFLLVPGVANLPAGYFGFRVVGHFLSLGGASRGLTTVAWTYQSSGPLTELRHVLSLDPGVRESRVHAIAKRLRLEHFVSFFERSAVST